MNKATEFGLFSISVLVQFNSTMFRTRIATIAGMNNIGHGGQRSFFLSTTIFLDIVYPNAVCPPSNMFCPKTSAVIILSDFSLLHIV